jgi:hypothetical protein
VENGSFEPSHRVNGDATLTLYFSLFLVLLAFFILLYTVAEQNHERSAEVVESVSVAFHRATPLPTVTGTTPAPAPAPGFGAPLTPEGLSVELGRLFAATVPLTAGDSSEPGALLQFVITADSLFLPDTIALRDTARQQLDRLAVLLGRAPTGIRYQVDLEIGTGPAADPQDRAVARAVAFAEFLESRGVPDGALAIGLRDSKRRDLRFTFRAVGNIDGSPS